MGAFALVVVVCVTPSASPAGKPAYPPLGTRTESGWQQYVTATERRIARQSADATRFLAMDFYEPAARDRQSVLAGGIPVSSMPEAAPDGRPIDVEDAWMHHWRGAVLIPGVTVNQVLTRLQAGVPPSSDVLSSTIRDSAGSEMHVFLRVQRRQSLGFMTLTLVYNTEHSVTFTRHGAGRASSASVATRIAEVDAAGSDRERELGAGADHGFLWRWNSYWRYQDTPAGVIAECESLALSRPAPWGTHFIAEPFAAGAAAESMTRALVSLREWFVQR
jgi:hypothetical protein